MKLLYILGSGRSGTTLIDNILSQLPGVFSTGEVRYIWDRSLIEGRLCGCGQPLTRCQIWGKVLGCLNREDGGPDPGEMVELRDRVARTRHLPMLLFPAIRKRMAASARPYLRSVERLYGCIHDVTQADLIVDSSKYPSYGLILEWIFGEQLHYVHVVRDPRAVAFSWQRQKPQPDSTLSPQMDRLSIFRASLVWLIWNLTAELIAVSGRNEVIRLKYEDFVRRPGETLTRVLRLTGLELGLEGIVAGSTVRLEPNHTVSGNPNRFVTGEINVKLDNEWEAAMPLWQRWLVTIICWPLMLKYGYLP